jgi:hypothetical protein
MNYLEFTHATLNTKIIVAKLLLFSFYYSQQLKCTMLLAAGGALIPVTESVEEVRAKLL